MGADITPSPALSSKSQSHGQVWQRIPSARSDSWNVKNHPSTHDNTPAKRKRCNTLASTSQSTAKIIDLTGDDCDRKAPTPKRRKVAPTSKGKDGEQRSRGFRKHPPKSYLQKLERALGQRMFVIDRVHNGTDVDPEETVELAGSTGNCYIIKINREPSCTCPDYGKGNQCKHIIYVLHHVLKAPEHLQYQLAFLTSELQIIFSLAPRSASIVSEGSDPNSPSNRKDISGDCPICFTDFEPETEDIVWCKAACGNNIHKDCFEQWARSQKGKIVKCVYCRTPWQGDEDSLKRIKETAKRNREGYLNVAQQLGLSGTRDYSTYHQPWVRRNFGSH
ncbi:hypothetical protein MMC09_002109 [Bachmanniomyces sp. S44760]|nr:hypothetical protein [Bachmanniomyces sp. S44760]